MVTALQDQHANIYCNHTPTINLPTVGWDNLTNEQSEYREACARPTPRNFHNQPIKKLLDGESNALAQLAITSNDL